MPGAGGAGGTPGPPVDLAAGEHSLVASGVAPDGSQRFLRMDVTVPVAGNSGAAGLAYTGTQVLVPVVIGLVALVLGAGLLYAGRRRRSAC